MVVVDIGPGATFSGHDLSWEVHNDWSTLELLRERYDALIDRLGSDVYLSCDWCRVWWAHYGMRRRLHVLAWRRGERLVGVLPMMIERLWAGPVPIRIAKIVGSDSTSVVLNPPVEPADAEAVYLSALQYLVRQQGCDLVWLGPLSGEQPHRKWVGAACERADDFARLICDADMGVHTICRLPPTAEAYLADLPGHQRRDLKRRERHLQAQGGEGDAEGSRVDFVDEPERAETVFDEFVRMHQQQWQSNGRLGHFGDWRKAYAFNRDLVRTLAPRGRVLLMRVSINDTPVAVEYAYLLGRRLFWRLAARLTGQPWDNLGLGRVCGFLLAKEAIRRGVQVVESGNCQYEYKRRLGFEDLPLGSVLIAANRPGAIARAHWLKGFSRAMHLGYYRLWFVRIAPRLPLPRRPLWNLWTRCRL